MYIYNHTHTNTHTYLCMHTHTHTYINKYIIFSTMGVYHEQVESSKVPREGVGHACVVTRRLANINSRIHVYIYIFY